MKSKKPLWEIAKGMEFIRQMCAFMVWTVVISVLFFFSLWSSANGLMAIVVLCIQVLSFCLLLLAWLLKDSLRPPDQNEEQEQDE